MTDDGLHIIQLAHIAHLVYVRPIYAPNDPFPAAQPDADYRAHVIEVVKGATTLMYCSTP